MVRLKRAILPLAVLLIMGTGMAGCLEAVVFDPDCAPTAVAATWTQAGVWETFPDEGEHGLYNVSVLTQQGHRVVDPEWGELVTHRIERTLAREEDNLSLVYRFDKESVLHVAAPAHLDEATIEQGFLEFLQEVSPMEERDLRPMIHQLIQKDGQPVQPSAAHPQTQTSDGDTHVEYTLAVDSPLEFDRLYQDILGESGQEERRHPWQQGTVVLQEWAFHFAAPVALANHTREEGRFLQVDGNDHVTFHWDPPTGIGEEAIHAGITRTLNDLGLEAPDFRDVETYTVTC